MCWAMLWKIPGLIMIAPTFALALFIAIRSRKNSFQLLPNLAILFWIIANSIWMIDEFFEADIRNYCLVFFMGGILIAFSWLIRFRKTLAEVVNQFTRR
jgi:uncharacterized membrane protein (GlpM family)